MSLTTPVVIKVGGAALTAPAQLLDLLAAVKLALAGRPWVLVHGGGATVDEWLTQAGQASSKIHGQRQTPANHMPLVTGALAGYTNKILVTIAQQAGLRALGMSLVDGVALPLQQNFALGCVGSPNWLALENNHSGFGQVLKSLLAAEITPVISSIGCFENGQLANVNADLAAAAIALVLDAELLLLSDVDAILDASGHAIGDISLSAGYALLEQSFVQGGMHVKLQAALEAASRCRRTTAITSWQKPTQVVALLQGGSVGTRIL
ncbi:acetylglutamate kinase [Aliidiomarina quisquiliarum]|uniref:acetylglutamate kinase n=1 Tax=Aliidiomarina quisquiliarum TaxID=2938947 RepID=UPI00208FCAD1|nr:acetylglutamate kinase [Aliidiomarina quisquiliarum]MCO4320911.1 acetylglutamate kinase [Aliidiomarina quisquiliarum]